MRALLLSVIALAIVAGAPKHASAEPEAIPWYQGEGGKRRITHMAITAGFAGLYVGSLLYKGLDPAMCRWCDPPGFDVSARNALVWKDVGLANNLSTIDAYGVAPVIGLTLLYLSDKDSSWTRLIDDVLPVAETVMISQTFTQIVKVSVGRARPYAHFSDTAIHSGTDDNLSFISGHSVLGFSITASAGMICHWRHYWTEPYVWGTGIALSLSAEYLRIAADKHYLSDVLAGGLVGLGFGLTIPRLMKHDVAIVPVPGGAAVVGMF